MEHRCAYDHSGGGEIDTCQSIIKTDTCQSTVKPLHCRPPRTGERNRLRLWYLMIKSKWRQECWSSLCGSPLQWSLFLQQSSLCTKQASLQHSRTFSTSASTRHTFLNIVVESIKQNKAFILFCVLYKTNTLQTWRWLQMIFHMRCCSPRFTGSYRHGENRHRREWFRTRLCRSRLGVDGAAAASQVFAAAAPLTDTCYLLSPRWERSSKSAIFTAFRVAPLAFTTSHVSSLLTRFICWNENRK